MRNFDTEPSFGSYKLPRHHYIHDDTTINVARGEDGQQLIFGHGKEGFDHAERKLGELIERGRKGLNLRYVFEGGDYVNQDLSEAPFALHGEVLVFGDNQDHSKEDLFTQEADFRRVENFNNSQNK